MTSKRPDFMEEEENRYEEKGRRLKDKEAVRDRVRSEGLKRKGDRRSMTWTNKTAYMKLNKRKISCGGGRFLKRFAR